MQVNTSHAQQVPQAVVQSAADYLAAQEGQDETSTEHQDSLQSAEASAAIWPHAEVVDGVVVMRLKYITKGRNPRTHFDEAEMASLTASVAQRGVIQAISIRPKDGGYQIVAGERRYRAAFNAHGEDYPIPVVIREMTDDEADAVAAIENHERADMSAAEWARVAASELGKAKGDREEAARVLGWSRSVLDRRLALMNCSDAVLNALNERKIKLGHAELLAALAKVQQDKFLPFIMSEDKPIAELKKVISEAACKLDAAIFDKADCGACPHNSSIQKAMFAESITDGGCTNPPCYKEKTEAALQGIADGLKDEWPVIRILRVGDNMTRTKLKAEGADGVGTEQADACRACSNYGAAVSGLPQALGQVFTSQCFDTACNASKVAERVKADTEALKVVAAAAGKGDGANESARQASAGSMPTKAEPSKPVKVTESERIKAYREQVWRKAMQREIAADPVRSRSYLLALALTGDSGKVSSTSIGDIYAKITKNKAPGSYSLEQAVTATATLSTNHTESLLTALAASAMSNIDVHKLRALASHHQLDLRKHWKLDEKFLDLLTKSEMEVLAKEVGLDGAFGEKFAKLFTEKKPDLIKALLAVESFDYSATIPKVLQY